MREPPANENTPKWLQRQQEWERGRDEREAAIDTVIYWGFMAGVVALAVLGWKAVGVGD